eukprot:7098-Eustigmatos_ZCMA.PRE.1
MRAVQLKTNRPISLFFATVGSLNAVLWSSFGLLSGDPWVREGPRVVEGCVCVHDTSHNAGARCTSCGVSSVGYP